MFKLVTGTMGGGKSYLAAELCMQFFKRGCHVHTCGVDLVPEAVAERGWTGQWVNLNPEYEITDKDEEILKPGTGPDSWRKRIVPGLEDKPNLLICDEAALLFAVDDQAKGDSKKANAPVFKMLVWARRYGLHVYFLSQSAANVDVKLRRMAAGHIHCVNVSRIPYIGKAMVPIVGQFRRSELNLKGGVIGASYARFQKEVATLYDTHGWAGKRKEVTGDQRQTGKPPVDRSAWWWYGGGIAAVGSIIAFALITLHRIRNPPIVGLPPSMANSGKKWDWAEDPTQPGQVSTPRSTVSAPEIRSINSVYDIPHEIVTTISGPRFRRKYRTVSGYVYALGEPVPGGRVQSIWAMHPGQWLVTLDTKLEIIIRKLTPNEKYQIWLSSLRPPLESASRAMLPGSDGILPAPSSAKPTPAQQSLQRTGEAVSQ